MSAITCDERSGENGEYIIKESSENFEGLGVKYLLLEREEFNCPFYSLSARRTDKEGLPECLLRDFTSDRRKAIAFYELVRKFQVTPSTIRYIYEDEFGSI